MIFFMPISFSKWWIFGVQLNHMNGGSSIVVCDVAATRRTLPFRAFFIHQENYEKNKVFLWLFASKTQHNHI